MEHKPWPGDGVGKGNGPGSARTHFKSGMPSANPKGRPRKPKPTPNPSLAEAMLRALSEVIPTTEHGVNRKRPLSEAMVLALLAEFSDAKPADKIAILKYAATLAPQALYMQPRQRDGDDARKVLLERLGEAVQRGNMIEAELRAAGQSRGPGTISR